VGTYTMKSDKMAKTGMYGPLSCSMKGMKVSERICQTVAMKVVMRRKATNFAVERIRSIGRARV